VGWVELRKWARDEKQIDGDLMGIRIIYSIPCESILHLPSIAQLYRPS